MQLHFSAEKGGNGLLCKIVLRRTETSAYYNYVRARKPILHTFSETAWIVADYRVMIDANSEIGKPLRQEGGVSIDNVPEQKLLTCAKNFRNQSPICHFNAAFQIIDFLF